MKIELPSGHRVVLDDEDAETVAPYSWIAHRVSGGRFYAASRPGASGRRPILYMHRLLMAPPPFLDVDHISGDGLDNRRCNLRICTAAQNNKNRPPGITGSSRFKGVHLHGQTGRWRAQIRVDGQRVSLGLHDDEIVAAMAYDQAAIAYHGPFAALNFPGPAKQDAPNSDRDHA